MNVRAIKVPTPLTCRKSWVSGYSFRAICSNCLSNAWIFVVIDSTCSSSGFIAACKSPGSASSSAGPRLSASHTGSRSPTALASPRAALISAVRASTSAARTRIVIRSCCAFSLRWRIGRSNCGSTRASRASVCASSRSSLRLLWLISCTCRALATITSWPNWLSSRLTHGECVPTSIAMRQRGRAPNAWHSPFFVVATLASRSTSPCSSSTQ